MIMLTRSDFFNSVTERRFNPIMFQSLRTAVLGGKKDIADWPIDIKVRVVPQDASFGSRGVIIGAFILYFSRIRERQEGMAKARRAPHLQPVIGRKFMAEPFTESRRAYPQIHHHVQDITGRTAHQLTHGRSHILIVNATENVFYGTGMIILNEFSDQAGLLKGLLMIGLVKKTAIVAEAVDFDNPDFGKECGMFGQFHRFRFFQ